MDVRRILAIMVMTCLVCCNAPRSEAAADDTVRLSGPENVNTGDLVEIVVCAMNSMDGVSADVYTEGLTFEGVSCELSASHGLVLLPQMGICDATYTYRVSAGVGDIALFELRGLTAGIGETDIEIPPQRWMCSIGGTSETAAELPADDRLQGAAELVFHGPDRAACGDTIQVAVGCGSQEVKGVLEVSGLAVCGVSGAACDARQLHLFPTAGLDTAVCTLRVTGSPGSIAAVRIGRKVGWSCVIEPPQALLDADAIELEADSDGLRASVCLSDFGAELKLSAFEAMLGCPPTWSMTMHDTGFNVRLPQERVHNGDWFTLRSEQGEELLSGRLLLIGDVSGSGRLDVAQLAALARLLHCGIQLPSADLNRNGTVDIDDLVRMAHLCQCAVS